MDQSCNSRNGKRGIRCGSNSHSFTITLYYHKYVDQRKTFSKYFIVHFLYDKQKIVRMTISIDRNKK
ncbi:unnamed protein product [Rhizophagus irregularis]|nr:unnamed protein product [Rhizophagus irregularis]